MKTQLFLLVLMTVGACDVEDLPEQELSEALFTPLTSTASFQTVAIGDRTTGTITVDFDAVPQAANIDAVTGLSVPFTATNYTDLAAIVRFNPAGKIDVRNGAAYAAAASVSYVGGQSYHIKMTVRMTSHTYDVVVTPAGSAAVTLASGYAFRAEQASALELRGLAVVAASGSHVVKNLVVPATGTLLYAASFQSGTMPPSLGLDEVAPDSLEIVTAPWNSARKALKVLVRHGESWNGSGYPRSEIHLADATSPARRYAFHTCYRLTTGIYFAAGTVFPTGEVTIFQIHGDDNRSPPLALQLKGGRINVGLLPDPDGSWILFDYGVVPTGQLLALEVIYQPSPGSDGYVKVTLGGKVVVEKSGANHTGARAANATGGYWKQGIYDYWKVVASALTVYNDDVGIYRL